MPYSTAEITTYIARAQRAYADYILQAVRLENTGDEPVELYYKSRYLSAATRVLNYDDHDLTIDEIEGIIHCMIECGKINDYSGVAITFPAIVEVVDVLTSDAALSTLTDGPGGGTGTLVGAEYRVPAVNSVGSAWEYKKAGFQGTVLYVSPSGIIGETEKGNIIYHYKNITVAQTAAVTGDTIIVMPGTYSDEGLGKDGVRYHFYSGANVICVNSLWVTGSAMSYIVTGDGYFENTADTPLINITAASTVSIKARSIKGGAIDGGNFQAGGASTLTIELTEDAISTAGYTFYVDGASFLYAKGRKNSAYITNLGINEVGTEVYLDFKEHITTSNAHTLFGNIFYKGGFADIKGKIICNGTVLPICIASAVWGDDSQNIINIHDDIEVNSTGGSFVAFGGSDATVNIYGKIIGNSTGARFGLATNAKVKANLYNDIIVNNTLSAINQSTGTLSVRGRVVNKNNTATANGIDKSGGTLILEKATIVCTHASAISVYANGTNQSVVVYSAVANRVTGGSTVLTEVVNNVLYDPNVV